MGKITSCIPSLIAVALTSPRLVAVLVLRSTRYEAAEACAPNPRPILNAAARIRRRMLPLAIIISAYLQAGGTLGFVSKTRSRLKKVKQELADDCLGLPGFSFAIPVVHPGPVQGYKLSHPDRGLYNKRPLWGGVGKSPAGREPVKLLGGLLKTRNKR